MYLLPKPILGLGKVAQRERERKRERSFIDNQEVTEGR
jgi:hypothetical protein